MENPLAYVHNNMEKYKTALYSIEGECARPELRFNVDYVEDVTILDEIMRALSAENPFFGCREVINYTDAHPHLKRLMNIVKDHLSKRDSLTSLDESFLSRCK
ncbi:hypothetical protein ACFLT9_03105 [Acidobacteriota bacterium]